MSERVETISREELYKRVWTTTFVRLARELGYSYVELVRICANLNIPRPSGGYWYRLQHGSAEEQMPLPPARPGSPTTIPVGHRKLEAEVAAVAAVAENESGETEVIKVAHAEEVTVQEPTNSHVPVPDEPPANVAAEQPEILHYGREQLHEAIWNTPCAKLAATLGVSDVALAKTCRRMGIPRPPRGHWARIEAGQKPRREPLPAAKPGQSLSVAFCVAENAARRSQWAVKNILTAGRGGRHEFVELPPEGSELHAIAERHLRVLEKAKPDALGFVKAKGRNLFPCEVTAAIVPRLVRALHAVACELEDRDFGFEPGADEDEGLLITADNDRVGLRWAEEKLEVEREPTNEEKRKPSWTWQLKETKASGKLGVEVSAEGLRGKRKWTEADGRSLEQVLGVVIEKVEAVFRGFEDRRKRETEWAKQREEQAKREAEERAQAAERHAKQEQERKQRERIRKHEAKLEDIAEARRENLTIAAQEWKEAQAVFAFIHSCEERWRRDGGGELSRAQSDWLSWARAEAGKLGPFGQGYPDPAIDGKFDASTVPVGGPYPELRVWPEEEATESAPDEVRTVPQMPVQIPQPYPYWKK